MIHTKEKFKKKSYLTREYVYVVNYIEKDFFSWDWGWYVTCLVYVVECFVHR